MILELNNTKQIIKTLQQRFSFDDIRVTFFDGHFFFIKRYYDVYIHLQTDLFLENCKKIFNNPNLTQNDLDIEKLAYLNYLNSQLLINSWSNFELFITLISDAILSNLQKNELLNIDCNRIKDLFKDTSLDTKQLEKINKFQKGHLAHCPIINKYGKIFKLINNDYSKVRNKKKDIDFLQFYGKLRNCIHSIYIYFGKDYSYNFNGITFQFINNTLLSQDKNKDSILVDMSIELRKIVFEITNLIIFTKIGLNIYKTKNG